MKCFLVRVQILAVVLHELEAVERFFIDGREQGITEVQSISYEGVEVYRFLVERDLVFEPHFSVDNIENILLFVGRFC